MDTDGHRPSCYVLLSSPYCFLNKNNLGPRSPYVGKCVCGKYQTFTNVPIAAERDTLLVVGKDVKSGKMNE